MSPPPRKPRCLCCRLLVASLSEVRPCERCRGAGCKETVSPWDWKRGRNCKVVQRAIKNGRNTKRRVA